MTDPSSRSPVVSGGRSRKRTSVMIAVAVIVAALSFLVFRGLGNATMYFRTADEAIAERTELGNKRFRIEGIVVVGSLRTEGADTDFSIESKGTKVDVDNRAATQGIFREGIPVVLEGRFAGDTNTFVSDRIMVKHDSSYTAKHPERVSTTILP